MKDDSIVEAILIGVIIAVAVFFIATLLFFMNTKNQMCRDFGHRLYGRELNWTECFVL